MEQNKQQIKLRAFGHQRCRKVHFSVYGSPISVWWACRVDRDAKQLNYGFVTWIDDNLEEDYRLWYSQECQNCETQECCISLVSLEEAGQGIKVRITGESLLAPARCFLQVKFIPAGSCLPRGLANFGFCCLCVCLFFLLLVTLQNTLQGVWLHLRDYLCGQENKEEQSYCPEDLHLCFCLEILG